MPNYNGFFIPTTGGFAPSDMTGMKIRTMGDAGSGLSNVLMPNQAPKQRDYPVIDSVTGKAVSVLTRKPFTGVSPHTGQKFDNGNLVANDAPAIDPNNVAQRYQPVDIIKSPDVATATGNLMNDFQKQAAAQTANFNDLLKQASDINAQNKAAFTREQASFNLGPYADRMRGLDTGYADTMRGLESRYAQSDADYEAALRNRIGQAYGILPQYDTAAQNIADRQLMDVSKAVKRYKLGTGTPTSLGSDELRLLMRGAQDVLLPMEQAKIQRKYDVLSGMDIPAEREIATRRSSRIAQFETPLEQSIYAKAYDTERMLKQLEIQTAGMSRANAEAYLRSLNLPVEIAQQVMSRNLANLGGLAALEEGSRYRGLQDKLGANLSQPAYFSFQAPGYPVTQPRSYPPAGAPMTAPGAPATIAPANGGVPYTPLQYNPLPVGASDQRFNLASPRRYQETGDGMTYYDTVTGELRWLGDPALQTQSGTVSALPQSRYGLPGSYTVQDGVVTPVQSRY